MNDTVVTCAAGEEDAGPNPSGPGRGPILAQDGQRADQSRGVLWSCWPPIFSAGPIGMFCFCESADTVCNLCHRRRRQCVWRQTSSSVSTRSPASSWSGPSVPRFCCMRVWCLILTGLTCKAIRVFGPMTPAGLKCQSTDCASGRTARLPQRRRRVAGGPLSRPAPVRLSFVLYHFFFYSTPLK